MTEQDKMETMLGPEGGMSAGQLLREAREAARYDIAVLAAALKVPVEKLQALEADRVDLLPDVTFARGLASSMCRTLGVDPALVLARMPRPGHRLASDDDSINAPFREPMGGGSVIGAALSKQAVWIGALLLLGAVALALLPSIPTRFGAEPSASDAAHSVNGTVSGTGDALQAASAAVPATELASAPVPAASDLAGASAPVSTALVTPSVPASGASAAAVGDSLIAFTARGESWISVRDARGKSLLNRALAAGETVALDGDTPLSVTVGRADLTDVSVRGQAYEMQTAAGAVVARFRID